MRWTLRKLDTIAPNRTVRRAASKSLMRAENEGARAWRQSPPRRSPGMRQTLASTAEDVLVNAFAVRVARGETRIGGLLDMQFLIRARCRLFRWRLRGCVHDDHAMCVLLEAPGLAAASLPLRLREVLIGTGAAGE